MIWTMVCPNCKYIMSKENAWDIWKCIICGWSNVIKDKVFIFPWKVA
jgi:ribosomal protein L37AE/L43A